jgi:putative mRNA 3-end processing factor
MLIRPTGRGLYCAAGDFYIDPWRPAARSVVTHAHSDHARPGSERVWAAAPSLPLLRHRLGPAQDLVPLAWGEPLHFGPVRVSLHPAGHILGSAQVRVEHGGEVWVMSGDYRRQVDGTAEPFEVVPCDVFITEATFACPVYRWPDPARVMADIAAWHADCARRSLSAVLLTYALGKAQRVLHGLRTHLAEPVWLHGAMVELTEIYRQAGIPMVDTRAVSEETRRSPSPWPGRLILAPPSAVGTPWFRRFAQRAETAMASGWMTIRGVRRRRAHDRGFVLSDHVDWDGLLQTIRETGARRVLATHGQSAILVRWLREQGMDADALETAFQGDAEA